jgi:hypothetical protein
MATARTRARPVLAWQLGAVVRAGAVVRGGPGVSEMVEWRDYSMLWLSGPEGDDAADRVVGGHADRDAITWNNFDPEAAHAAAQLCEHFVSRIALHAIEAAGMDSHHGALHVDQIVFTQYLVLFRV